MSKQLDKMYEGILIKIPSNKQCPICEGKGRLDDYTDKCLSCNETGIVSEAKFKKITTELNKPLNCKI